MVLKKIKLEVERTDQYIIEIDPTIYNKRWFEAFRKSFYDFFTLNEVAEHLAQFQARFGTEDGFIEGFGYVTRNGKLPPFFDRGKDKRTPAPGINIVIISESEDVGVNHVKDFI